MKKGKLFLLAGAIAFSLSACDKDNDNDSNVEQSNSMDLTFAPQASMSNMAEISLGNLAASMGTNAGVRSFGQMMVSDHGSAQTQLQTAASNANLVTTVTDSSVLVAMRAQLMGMSGRAFDSAYLRSQITAHQATLTLLQNEVNSGIAPSLKAYATAQIPHVQQHLTLADSLYTHL
jgi:putative membrane protein